MPLVDRLERRFGWIAVPGIVKIIMCLQALVWFLTSVRNDPALLLKIYLDKDLILNGEVWRVVSFVVMPPPVGVGFNGIIFMFFAVFFSIFLGNMLESIWGSFRLTLYLIGGVAGMVIAEFLIPGQIQAMSSVLLIESILFACAVYNPNYIVRLFGIIPVRLFWIAIFSAGLFFIEAVTNLWLLVSIIISLGNFFVVFVPGMKRSMQMKAQVAVRRNKFEAAKVPENEPLHLCASCGKTENDDEDLIFRVADDGGEYCEDCRGKNVKSDESSNLLNIKNEDGSRAQVSSEDEKSSGQKMVSRYKKNKKRPGQWKE